MKANQRGGDRGVVNHGSRQKGQNKLSVHGWRELTSDQKIDATLGIRSLDITLVIHGCELTPPWSSDQQRGGGRLGYKTNLVQGA